MRKETNELTDLELSRFEEFKKSNPTAKSYYITDFSLGAGYCILASTLDLTKDSEVDLINDDNTVDITDVENLLNVF